MGNTQILQIIGIIYVLLGLGMLINPKYHSKVFKDLIENESNTYLLGFIGLVVGYLLITFTGKTTGWFIIIPIFGWIGLIKSALFFLAPQALMGITKIFLKKKEYLIFMGILVTIFGGILTYVSFLVL